MKAKEPPLTFPSGTKQLFAMYMLYSLVYRGYYSCSVLALSKIADGSVVATSGLLISALIFLTSSHFGSIIDRTDRMVGMRVLMLSQIVSVSCEYLLSLYCIKSPVNTTNLVLFVLPCLVAVSNLLLSLCSMTLEKGKHKVQIAPLSAFDLNTDFNTYTRLGCSSCK